MKYLEERNIGFDVGVTKVPLVCQSSLFDLAIGSKDARPDQRMGYAACENASREPMKEGNVGAGCGCTVGKYHGPANCMKSGIGTYAVQLGEIKVAVSLGFVRYVVGYVSVSFQCHLDAVSVVFC